MIGLVSRLFFLQVKENKKYLTLSDKNRIREWKLAPVRGEFKDYFGNTIAGNFEAYQLHVIPEQVEDFRYVIYRLKDLLELNDKEFRKVLKKKNEIKPWETLIVSDNLSWQKFSKINNHLYDLNGVKPVISISRNYPYKENFTHLIGLFVYHKHLPHIFRCRLYQEVYLQMIFLNLSFQLSNQEQNSFLLLRYFQYHFH